MWIAGAQTQLKAAFDRAIEAAYGKGRGGELENLANLFSPTTIGNFQRALQAGLDGRSAATVDIAWVDKRPIAKLSPTAPGAELGDMMIVVEEYYPGNSAPSASRACLLEVKQSRSQIIPPVPVTSGASTKNQLTSSRPGRLFMDLRQPERAPATF
ncbi:hypothetical protein [Massilia endophytica]|uniref:hypothetical protein n=1 Tax=Massilia endophytica TaxID=2899220 RepID=UPI001E35FAED|nr:hypothetical protein [Massilia endophytica]UGQ47313.1 hypothetical protein LSQ66_02195 [Massilia endophytica]